MLCCAALRAHRGLTPRGGVLCRAAQFWRTLFYLSLFATRATTATFKLLSSPKQRQEIGAAGVESVLMLQSVGIGATVAVVPLFSWHCYLMGSAQTTIEYFGNSASRADTRRPPRSHTNSLTPLTRLGSDACTHVCRLPT